MAFSIALALPSNQVSLPYVSMTWVETLGYPFSSELPGYLLLTQWLQSICQLSVISKYFFSFFERIVC